MSVCVSARLPAAASRCRPARLRRAEVRRHEPPRLGPHPHRMQGYAGRRQASKSVGRLIIIIIIGFILYYSTAQNRLMWGKKIAEKFRQRHLSINSANLCLSVSHISQTFHTIAFALGRYVARVPRMCTVLCEVVFDASKLYILLSFGAGIR